ncbi:MAG: NIL domain-containing protein [Candidatus Poribacteria bacterium]|nr:NIL domain-containing protein [Candidatus Poribacteria bacterium]
MPSRRVRLTFPTKLVKEPIIYNVGVNFQVVTNIRRANIENSAGWVVLEISGGEDALTRAEEYMRDLGVEVEPIVGDIVDS